MLKLRPIVEDDIPSLVRIIEEYWEKFSDDFTPFSIDKAEEIFRTEHVLTVDFSGYPVGIVAYLNPVEDLYARLLVVLDAFFLKRALKEQLLNEIMRYAFDVVRVNKVCISVMETQKGVIDFLRRQKFVMLGKLYRHTKYKGKKVDIVLFEVRKNKWGDKR